MFPSPAFNNMVENGCIEGVDCGPGTLLLNHQSIEQPVSESMQCNARNIDGKNEERKLLVRVSGKGKG